jgi:hypothetical protein
MRTNVNLTEDAREFAELYAHANGLTLSNAISALILQARDAANESSAIHFERGASGFPISPLKGRAITTKMVLKAQQEEDLDSFAARTYRNARKLR